MKSNLSKLTKNCLSAVLLISIGFGTNSASANRYYSPAPNPPEIPYPKDSMYLTTTVNGIDFYAITPYWSQETPDKNLFISSLIVMQNSRGDRQASYVQINCGKLWYRDLVPWMNINGYGDLSVQRPSTYQWQNFIEKSAFETAGKRLCERGASDRGIRWVWYR